MSWEALVVAGKGNVVSGEGPARALVTAGRPLVVHFHGGIVDEKAGLELARRLGDETYGPAGHDALFLVWKTGPFEVLGATLRQAIEETFAKRLVELVLRWAAGKLQSGGKSVGFGPMADSALFDAAGVREFAAELAAAEAQGIALSPNEARLFENAVAADQKVGNAVQALVAEPEAGAKGLEAPAVPTLMDADVLDELRGETAHEGKALFSWAAVAKKALAILVRVIRRFADGSHHGLHTTVVQELAREFYLAAAGRFLWSSIKEQAEQAFSGPQLAGSLLADLLVARHAAGGPPPAIVAHSAGSIYTGRLLEHLAGLRSQGTLPADWAVDRVVFLAPAVRVSRFASTLRTVGPGSNQPVFRRFRMFAMQDPVEQSDAIAPFVLPRSLLYYVAGVAEDAVDTPLLGMQRYFSARRLDGSPRFDDPDTAAVRALVEPNTVWSVANGAPGSSSASAKHGDFDNDPDTLASVAHLLQGGP